MEIQRIEGGWHAQVHYNLDAISAELQALLDEKELGREHQFFLDVIQRRGGLALELGSGTGCRLLPYLLAGVHVHGVEASAELFAICQARAQKLGVLPTVHRQTLDRLDVPMSFKTIYAPLGIFQKIDSLESAEIVLQKLFEHLEMNGVLIIALQAPSIKKISQSTGIWEIVAHAERSHDKAKIILSQAVCQNIVEQQMMIMQRYEIVHANGHTETHMGELLSRWYHKFEFTMMLERAGFSEVSVVGDYSTQNATDKDDIWLFWATKKG